MSIWTDGKYVASCQQESKDATKIHLGDKKLQDKALPAAVAGKMCQLMDHFKGLH